MVTISYTHYIDCKTLHKAWSQSVTLITLTARRSMATNNHKHTHTHTHTGHTCTQTHIDLRHT